MTDLATPGTPYEKDGKGRVLQYCGGTVVPAVNTVGPNAGKRNHSARVIVEDGVPFEHIIRLGGDEYVLCTGVTSAKAGKMCSLFARLRAEADVAEPPEVSP